MDIGMRWLRTGQSLCKKDIQLQSLGMLWKQGWLLFILHLSGSFIEALYYLEKLQNESVAPITSSGRAKMRLKASTIEIWVNSFMRGILVVYWVQDACKGIRNQKEKQQRDHGFMTSMQFMTECTNMWPPNLLRHHATKSLRKPLQWWMPRRRGLWIIVA